MWRTATMIGLTLAAALPANADDARRALERAADAWAGGGWSLDYERTTTRADERTTARGSMRWAGERLLIRQGDRAWMVDGVRAGQGSTQDAIQLSQTLAPGSARSIARMIFYAGVGQAQQRWPARPAGWLVEAVERKERTFSYRLKLADQAEPLTVRLTLDAEGRPWRRITSGPGSSSVELYRNLTPGVRPDAITAPGLRAGPLAKMERATARGVAALERGQLETARLAFEEARQAVASKTIERLIKLAELLADEPTEHVEQVVELTGGLRELKHAAWRRTGVVPLAQRLHERWRGEAKHASAASQGDTHYAREQWKQALEAYRKLPRDSAFRLARQQRIDAASRKLAEALYAQAEKALDAADTDRAHTLIEACLEAAPAELTAQVFQLKQAIHRERAAAKALRQARDLIARKQHEAARAALRKIPERSRFYRQAAELLDQLAED